MRLFFLSVWRALLLIPLALAAPFERGRRPLTGILIILALPLYFLWQLVQLLGLLLDEVLFRRYRKIAVKRPIFVIGPPRTGTTHLHHVLAADSQTTTFRTWECLFGLSISARYLGRTLGKLYRTVGAPLSGVFARLGTALTGPLDDIHPLRLDAPEEDFLSFLPLTACFLLLVPFPKALWLYRIARCDNELGKVEREALMRYYRRCIQRHLFVNGRDKTFLSKNASFCGTITSLLAEFKDARVIATIRDPEQVVPSQLSSLKPGFTACGFDALPDDFKKRLLPLLAHYYENLADADAAYPGRIAFIDNHELRHALKASVLRAFSELDTEPSNALLERLAHSSSRESTNASKHSYSLEEFGLSKATVRLQFATAYRRFAFGTDAAEQDQG